MFQIIPELKQKLCRCFILVNSEKSDSSNKSTLQKTKNIKKKTILIVGYSMVNGIEKGKLSKKFKNAHGQFIANCPPKHVITSTYNIIINYYNNIIRS